MKEKIIEYKYLIVALLVTAGLFYWFQIRPSQIKSDCSVQTKEKAKTALKQKAQINPYSSELQKAAEQNMYLKKDYEDYYEYCLHEKGL